MFEAFLVSYLSLFNNQPQLFHGTYGILCVGYIQSNSWYLKHSPKILFLNPPPSILNMNSYCYNLLRINSAHLIIFPLSEFLLKTNEDFARICLFRKSWLIVCTSCNEMNVILVALSTFHTIAGKKNTKIIKPTRLAILIKNQISTVISQQGCENTFVHKIVTCILLYPWLLFNNKNSVE